MERSVAAARRQDRLWFPRFSESSRPGLQSCAPGRKELGPRGHVFRPVDSAARHGPNGPDPTALFCWSRALQMIGRVPANESTRDSRLHGLFGEHLMYQRDRRGAFADRRRDTLHAAAPDVTHGEHPRPARLKLQRRSLQLPA